MAKKIKFSEACSHYQDLQDERSEWEAEWQTLSDYLMPGRGIYQTYSKPSKRKLTSDKVVNPLGGDALNVLTSGLHGGLTSPSRPWFKLQWSDPNIRKVEPLKAWLQQCEDRLHSALHASNFYSVINNYYVEYSGFGTGCMYIGDDTDDVLTPFRFEVLTVGEYAFSMGFDGKPSTFFRTIFMSKRQLVERFPKTVDSITKEEVKNNKSGVDKIDIAVLECLYKTAYKDKPWTRYYFQVTGGIPSNTSITDEKKPLEVSGFYEFPYVVARWSVIGSDVWGIGPGSRALEDIKRLQQMEKALLLATHKAVNPPLNAPSRMRGKIKSLPGAKNYYKNPTEVVSELYQLRFDFSGVSAVIERVENRIQRNFFNDIFLTASRDPNATPYKATEVTAREQEKMLRLGPPIEALQKEFLDPSIERMFNIMLRNGFFEELPPELAQLAGEFEVNMVSPLATAQRGVALQGINSFLAFVGQAIQLEPLIMDNLDVDAVTREYADITGIKFGLIRLQESVDQIRANRQKQEEARAKQEQELIQAQAGSQLNSEVAGARKDQAEATLANIEGQQMIQEAGAM